MIALFSMLLSGAKITNFIRTRTRYVSHVLMTLVIDQVNGSSCAPWSPSWHLPAVWSLRLTPAKQPLSNYFNTITYRQPNGHVIKMDYYSGGPKAAETTIKDGMKHQNSESFYPTGEQFRSALYYYDTLVREVYFYKNGDTIKNFPTIPDTVLGHVILRNSKFKKKIEFDCIDGKIVAGTYVESHLQ